MHRSRENSLFANMPVIGHLFRGPDEGGPGPAPTARVVKQSRDEHLAVDGRPKRILALDGGGVRGILSIAVLERIEDILRAKHGNDPDFRLCDYFDLVGGTSTGGIISSALTAKQMRASEVYDLYTELAPKVFQRKFIDAFRRPRGIYAAFDSAHLESELKRVLGDITLGDDRITTGFAAIAKRVDTDSAWVLANNPQGKFHATPRDHKYIGNGEYPLTKIVRASTAAPFYFPPEKIFIAKGRHGEPDEVGLFMDGGITMHNNPCLQLLLLVSLEGYNFNWNRGPEDLMMISVGTGSLHDKTPTEKLDRKMQMFKTIDALSSMIAGSEDIIETVMQWVASPLDPTYIDSEIEDMRKDLACSEPLLSYQRYNAKLNDRWLRDEIGMKLSAKDLKLIKDMTNPAGMDLGYEIGQRVAEKYVRPEHFPNIFDVETVAAGPSV